MSSDLIWNIVRNNNCFLVKRNGTVFTREPRNLTNKHSPKYSGLSNKKAVGVETTAQKGGAKFNFSLVTKKGSVKVNNIKKNLTNANKTVGHSVKVYRADLAKVAAARYSQLYKASKRVVKPIVPGQKPRRTFVKKN